MKYNPKINDAASLLPGFTNIHPLQDTRDVQGCLEVLSSIEKALCEITGMQACQLFSRQPVLTVNYRSSSDQGMARKPR